MNKYGRTVYLHPAAVVIGEVEIGEYSSLWPCAVARAPRPERREVHLEVPVRRSVHRPYLRSDRPQPATARPSWDPA